MKSEPEPNASDREKGIALVVAYLILVLLFSLMQLVAAYSQGTTVIQGRVTDEQGQGLIGALIRIKGSAHGTSTGKEGEFSLRHVTLSDTLIVSYLGFHSEEVVPGIGRQPFTILLNPNTTALQEVEVVSTGYQDIPKERATGSFVHVDHELLNRRISTSILERLDGVTSGLIFNANNNRQYHQSDIQIRGRATLFANADPLIVVDNFPYDGDINNLNPNDVQSISILKDAAAASAWGARSGNGVIVITTKKGQLNGRAKISLNSSLTIGEKPDLYYMPQLSSADYIDVEQFLFNQGAYDLKISNGFEAISPAVSIFSKTRRGEISPADSLSMIGALKGYDSRDQVLEHYYRPSVFQQYQASISGGSPHQKYFLSAGYDKNLNSYVNNNFERISLNASNTYYFMNNKLELLSGVQYSASKTRSGPVIGTTSYPYERIADENGNPLAIAGNLSLDYIGSAATAGKLDWTYKPLQELNEGYSRSVSDLYDLRLNLALNYAITPALKASALYTYEKGERETSTTHELQSYYTRNLINTFTQTDPATGGLSYPVPLGDIRYVSSTAMASHNGRFQLAYGESWGRHELNAIAGAEIRDFSSLLASTGLYGYNSETAANLNASVNYTADYPYSYGYNTGRIPTNIANSGSIDRYVSYYSNASYSYDQRYIVSFSARRDESNLFGVETNQKGVPLWSAGLAWALSREGFYGLSWLPELKLRATYGYTGNVDKTVSAYLTAERGRSSHLYNTAYTAILNPPNPSLRWEKVRNVNLGADFSALGNRISGSVDYWFKRGIDLIGNSPLAPQTGLSLFKGNAADTRSHGLDLMLNSVNLRGAFRWQTTLLYNISRDKVTGYKVSNGSNYNVVSANYNNPLEGYPYYSIFSFRYAGLDPEGDPLGYLNGERSTDYNQIMNSVDRKELVYIGSASPTTFGSLRNSFAYRGFDLSVNLVYKFGYFFRRSSLSSGSLYSAGGNNYQMADYGKQWEQPGDELTTEVPKLVYPANTYRDQLYLYSDRLVEKGDHIRVQDIRLGFSFGKNANSPISNLNVFSYVNNVGMLWRANGYGIDPDYPTGIPAVRTIAFGFRAYF